MKTNKTPVEHVPPYEASEADWEDFFASEALPEDAFSSVAQDDEWLCVASQHGRIAFQQTDERLAEQAKKSKGSSSRYEPDW